MNSNFKEFDKQIISSIKEIAKKIGIGAVISNDLYNSRIKDELFEIIIPEYATSKKDFMIKTYNNLASYTIIESIANAINRMLK